MLAIISGLFVMARSMQVLDDSVTCVGLSMSCMNPRSSRALARWADPLLGFSISKFRSPRISESLLANVRASSMSQKWAKESTLHYGTL